MAAVQLPAAKVVFKDYQGNTILGQIKNRFKVPLKFKVLINNRVLLCTFKRSAREHFRDQEKGRYKMAIILLLSYFQNIRKQLWFQKSENKLISQPRMHRFQKSLCPFQTTPNLPNWIDFNPSYGNLKKIKIPKIWNLIKFLLLSWPMIIRKFISGGVSETS